MDNKPVEAALCAVPQKALDCPLSFAWRLREFLLASRCHQGGQGIQPPS